MTPFTSPKCFPHLATPAAGPALDPPGLGKGMLEWAQVFAENIFKNSSKSCRKFAKRSSMVCQGVRALRMRCHIDEDAQYYCITPGKPSGPGAICPNHFPCCAASSAGRLHVAAPGYFGSFLSPKSSKVRGGGTLLWSVFQGNLTIWGSR